MSQPKIKIGSAYEVKKFEHRGANGLYSAKMPTNASFYTYDIPKDKWWVPKTIITIGIAVSALILFYYQFLKGAL